MTVHTKKSMWYILMSVLLSMVEVIGGHQYLFIANENQQINNNDMTIYPQHITSERETNVFILVGSSAKSYKGGH